MRSQLNRSVYFTIIVIITFFTAHTSASAIPECPKKILIKDGKVIDAQGWDYSFDLNFINKENKKITMQDGTLVSDYKFPEVSKINTSTNSVTGGLSYDEIEESDSFLSLTWNIEEINKFSTAVFVCDFHGDREKERPIRLVYLHKVVPKDFRKCTVTYEMVEYERVPESQTLECQ